MVMRRRVPAWKDTEEYKDAKAYAARLATEAGYPAIIRHWPATGKYEVELVRLDDDTPMFEIVDPDKES